MSKARTLANLISDNAELADGQISVAEVVGAAPTANPTFTGNIGVAGNITNASGDLTLDVAGDIILNADADIKFQGVDGVSTITALTLDMSDAGRASFNAGLLSNNTNDIRKDQITSQFDTSSFLRLHPSATTNSGGYTNMFFGTSTSNNFGVAIGGLRDGTDDTPSFRIRTHNDSTTGVDVLTMTNAGYSTFRSGAIFNENSDDADFRVESDSNANMLFVDAGNDQVVVGDNGNYFSKFTVVGGKTRSTGVPLNQLSVYDNSAMASSTGGAITLWGKYTTGGAQAEGASIEAYKSNGTSGNYQYGMWLKTRTHGGSMDDRLFMDQAQTVFNETGANTDFRIESDSNTHMLFVDAGNNRVGMNDSSPASALSIIADEAQLIISGSTGGNARGLKISTATTGYQSNDTVIIDAHNAASGEMQLKTQSVQRLKINSGVAVFNEDSTDTDFRVESNNKSQMMLIDAGQDRVAFGNGNTSRAFFTIDNDSGESTKPTLYVEGYPASAPTSIIRRDNTDAQYVLELHHDAPVSGSSGTGYMLKFADRTGILLGSITSAGASGTTYNTTSDRRLKDNIEPIEDATDKLMSMKPVTHTWIANPEAPSVHGFIAQEMQEVVPEAVSGEDGGEEMMSMDYGRITPVLVAALQEATNEIKALKQRVSELEAK